MSESKKRDGRKKNGGPRPKVRPDDRRGAPKGSFGNVGYKANEADREIVRTYGVVLSDGQLAEKLEISIATLHTHYRKELRMAVIEAGASLGSKVFKQAMNGHFPSQRFWLRTRFGWAERSEHTGPGGGPIQHENIDNAAEFLASLPEKEYARVKRLWDEFANGAESSRHADPDRSGVPEG